MEISIRVKIRMYATLKYIIRMIIQLKYTIIMTTLLMEMQNTNTT